MHLDLTGRPVPDAPMRERSFVVENLDFASRLSRTRATALQVQPSARRVRSERAWFATDDALPFVSMAIRQLGPAYRRVRTRYGRNGSAHAAHERDARHGLRV
jgi:hypothetical protein